MAELDSYLALPDARDKVLALQAWVDRAIAGCNVREVLNFVTRVLSEDVPSHVTKPVLGHFVGELKKVTNGEVLSEVAGFALSAMSQSPVNLDEAAYVLRDHMFGFYINCGQFADAAATLAGVNVDSVSRPFSEEDKVDIYIKCAEAYLEDDMAVEAEVFMNKSSPFINVVTNWVLQLRYKVTFARVQDANRKFSEAAVRYYELSTLDNQSLVEDELLELLTKAITCAILSKTSVQRTRVLGLICKDERLSDLEHNPKYAVHAAIVQKMFREQIVKGDEVKQLDSHLADHQRALTADGSTVLQKAVIEHNMLATSKIYSNVHFSELSSLLGVDERRAEKIAATMIAENRLKASIDQVERAVVFEDRIDHSAELSAQIGSLCKDVAAFVELAEEALPAWG